MKLELCLEFSKNFQMQISIKMFPVGAELFYADRRTDGLAWGS
jgi:hypothetical protein